MLFKKIRGGIKPQEIGLSFKEVRRVYIGECGATGKWKVTVSWSAHTAHAHVDPKDPWFHCICIDRYGNIFNSDRTPSEVMLHEYAHILTDYSKYKFTYEGTTEELLASQPKFHSDDWAYHMKKLGLKPRLWAEPPY